MFGSLKKKYYLCTRNSETTVIQSLLSVSKSTLCAMFIETKRCRIGNKDRVTLEGWVSG